MLTTYYQGVSKDYSEIIKRTVSIILKHFLIKFANKANNIQAMNFKNVFLTWRRKYFSKNEVKSRKMGLWLSLLYFGNCNPFTLSLNANPHCVKNVQIRRFFWSVFSCIWAEYGNLLSPSTGKYEYRKIRSRKNSVFRHFSRSDVLILDYLWIIYK